MCQHQHPRTTVELLVSGTQVHAHYHQMPTQVSGQYFFAGHCGRTIENTYHKPCGYKSKETGVITYTPADILVGFNLYNSIAILQSIMIMNRNKYDHL